MADAYGGSRRSGPDRRLVAVGGALVVLVLLGFALSRCGGDDGDDDAPVATETATPAPAPTPSPTPDPGPSPTDITAQLQADLTELGFYDGPISGTYDDATEAAVRAFQEFAGIAVDGVVGPQTAAALDVALGRTGESTATLQTALAALCYYDDEIDGIYGPATTEAVREFQVDSGLEPDGSYGPATAEALVQAWPDRPASCPTEAPPDDAAPPDEEAPPDGETPPEDEAPPQEDETVNAVTAIGDDLPDGGIVFNDKVTCVLGPDDSGSVQAAAEDGTTIVATLDGTASEVVIQGPSVSYEAPFTSVSNDQFALTIEAGPPPVTVLVVLSFCTEG